MRADKPFSAGDPAGASTPDSRRAGALARGDRAEALRRLEEAIAGLERLLARSIRADSITSVLAAEGRECVRIRVCTSEASRRDAPFRG
jgi:hypothetical protein